MAQEFQSKRSSGGLSAKRGPIPISGKKWKPKGIARGRLRTMATTGSRKMAAKLQLTGWQRHAPLFNSVLLWKTMVWSIDTWQNKVSADQYHVTISQTQSSLRSPVFLKQPRSLLVSHLFAHLTRFRGRKDKRPRDRGCLKKTGEVLSFVSRCSHLGY